MPGAIQWLVVTSNVVATMALSLAHNGAIERERNGVGAQRARYGSRSSQPVVPLTDAVAPFPLQRSSSQCPFGVCPRTLAEVSQAVAPLRLSKVAEEPLFPNWLVRFEIEEDLPPPNASGGVVMLYYHKTGCLFSRALAGNLDRWHNKRVEFYMNRSSVGYKHGRAFKSFWDKDIAVSADTYARVGNPSSSWRLPLNVRVLHFYRDPVKAVMSAYRYHSDNTSAESWEKLENVCHECHADDHETIFELCEFNCSYHDLLQKLDEITGVAVEMVHSREQFMNMIGSLRKWANDPNVLHLSMEHLQEDFNATVDCMFAFLGETGGLEHLEEIVPPESSHVTFDKYNNDELAKSLEAHPVWGPQLQDIRRLGLAISERQAKLYNCPVPSL